MFRLFSRWTVLFDNIVIIVLFVSCSHHSSELKESEMRAEPDASERGSSASIILYTKDTLGEGKPDIRFVPAKGIEIQSVQKKGHKKVLVDFLINENALLGQRTISLETENLHAIGKFKIQEAALKPAEFKLGPDVVKPGDNIDVKIFGVGTHFEQGQSIIRAPVDSGIFISNFAIQDKLNGSFKLVVDADAIQGSRALEIVSGLEVATGVINVGDDVNTAPTITISPTKALAGTTVQFSITGTDTHFNADTKVSFGPDSGISVESVVVQSSTVLTFDAKIEENIEPGNRTLYISGPTGQNVEILSINVDILSAVACYQDDWEDNNDIGHASVISFPMNISASICPGDHDYFKVNLAQWTTVEFLAQFSHTDGDLDMELLNLQGQLLASSTTTNDNEFLSYNTWWEAGERVIHIWGKDSSANNYTLVVDNEVPNPCNDDQYEPNDSVGDAAVVTVPGTVYAQVCENNDDFYSVDLFAGIPIEILAEFTHSSGDLDVYLISSDGVVVGASESRDDNEMINFTPNETGNYYLLVSGYNGARNSYTLNLSGTQTDTDTESDTDTVPDFPCDNPVSVAPLEMSIGRYDARLTIKGESTGWLSEEITVSLIDNPENITLNGCTVTTPEHISCDITVGLFSETEYVGISVQQGSTEYCALLGIVGDDIFDADIPQGYLPEKNEYTGAIDSSVGNRSDFYHLNTLPGDTLVFHAYSPNRTTMDPVLRLIDGSGNDWLIFEDDETPLGMDSRMAYYFQHGGEYYLEVGPKFNETRGDYSLYIYRISHGSILFETSQNNDEMSQAQVVTRLGEPLVIHGDIEDQQDIDFYQITTLGPTAIDVVARRVGPWDNAFVDARLIVYRLNGELLESDVNWYESPTTGDPRVFIDYPGTFRIEVSSDVNTIVDSNPPQKHTGFYALNIRNQVVINEIDNRLTSEDPFVELLGPPNTSLTEYEIFTFGGDGLPVDDSFPSVSLGSYATDSAGYFYIASSDLQENVNTLNLPPGPGAVVLVYNGMQADKVQYGEMSDGDIYSDWSFLLRPSGPFTGPDWANRQKAKKLQILPSIKHG